MRPFLFKNKLKGKFIIVYDTLCDGWQCMMDGNEGEKNYVPTLYNSEDEAFAEIFDSNLAMLQAHEMDNQLKEYNEGVTITIIKKMSKINKSGKVKTMRAFMDKYPQCDDSGEWVEQAKNFIIGRKSFYTKQGIVISDKKLCSGRK